MATIKQIQFKRSTASGTKPAVAQLAEGELAINLADRTIFTKDHNNQIIDLGFAKGGTINGDVIQIGNYKQTGQYTLTGNIDASGDITAHGKVWTRELMIRPLDQGASFIIENHSNVSKDLRIIVHSTGELPTDYDRLLFRSINDTNDLDPMSISWSKNGTETVVDVYGKLNSHDLFAANKAVIASNFLIGNALGYNSLVLGDNDTGFKWVEDGRLDFYSNYVSTFKISASENEFTRRTRFRFADWAGNGNDKPPIGYGLIEIATVTDGTGGDSYLGLSEAQGFSHYLRGGGTTWLDTKGGVNITQGPLNVTNGRIISGQATLIYDGNILGPVFDGNLKHYIDNKIIASDNYLFGAPIPWPQAAVPAGYVAMEGQAIDAEANPRLAAIYGAALPDMRGQTIKGLPAGRDVLSREGNQNRSHTHGGGIYDTDLGRKWTTSHDYGSPTTSWFDYGTKGTTGAGGHSHTFKGPLWEWKVPSLNGVYEMGINTTTTTTSWVGDHAHIVDIGGHNHTVPIGAHSHYIDMGAHSHGLTINAEGGGEVTVNNVAFKYIVRLG